MYLFLHVIGLSIYVKWFLTQALNIKPAVARDFSLMIQSCGNSHKIKIDRPRRRPTAPPTSRLWQLQCVSARDDCGRLHNLVDADKAGATLAGVLQCRGRGRHGGRTRARGSHPFPATKEARICLHLVQLCLCTFPAEQVRFAKMPPKVLHL